MDALADHGLVWGSLLSLLFYALYTRLTSKSPKLPDLPWIGTDPKKSFANIRANIDSIRNVRQWLAEGYENYSLKGKSYVFPNLLGAPEIIVPRSQTQWLLEKPDNVLSTSAMHYDALEGDYAFTNKRLLEDPYHEHVVHRNLARRLGGKLMEIWDEVTCSLDDIFGTEQSMEWKEVCVFETLTITNCLFDLFASDPAQGYVNGIREEATRVYRECSGKWDKAALARMVRTDSAIRESMRVSNFMTRGIARKVVAPEGVTNEKEGWHVPEGVYVSMDVHSVQHDPTVYPDPESYDAFRFSRPREGAGISDEDEKQKDTTNMLRLKNLSLVTTGETFLPFGHGRHACPGRFFVSHELKLLIAYTVMNYDIEPLPKRPPNQWIGQTVIPPMKACIRVRRRAATHPT